MTHRVIFLDIDGVLNNATKGTRRTIKGMKGYHLNDPRCVALLNNLTDVTQAKIVISSTWRLGETLENMQKICKCMGITAEVIGMTPSLRFPGAVRGNEILAWIKSNEHIYGNYHNFQNYVIIDDDSDMLLWQKDNFVLTDGEYGLTRRGIAKAYRILMQEYPPYEWGWMI
jgi:hypothetical protein